MDAEELQKLAAMLKEAEQLLQFPSVEGHYDKASKLLLSIARSAPTGSIANIAMKAVSLAYLRRNSTAPDQELNTELWRLREALRQAKADKAP
ncbi:MAG: hypothetical protein ACT4P4_13025 [Betaproteobacteria bacterium]